MNSNTAHIPDIVTISVRAYAGTYIATARDIRVRASCTSGVQEAAHSCACKIFGPGNFELYRVTDQTFIASRISPAAAALLEQPSRSPWRTDLPDADLLIVLRLKDPDMPFTLATYGAYGWHHLNDPEEVVICGDIILGWMHLHDAAVLLGIPVTP